MDPTIILIAGPTASGKSSVALHLGEILGGDIINADSMQVYRELEILTARPTCEDEERVPHYLYGICSVGELFSAARWCTLAAEQITRSLQAGRTPIVVGGTGLYFKALLEGLVAIPEIAEDVRARVRGDMAELGAQEMHRRLAECDPQIAARLEPADRQRIARALEVFHGTGKPLSAWQEAPHEGPLADAERAGHVHKFVLLPPRDWLYERCEQRFDAMLEGGALDEVGALANILASGADNLPALKALGVGDLSAYLRADMSLEAATERGKTATRQYAKRQYTWMRNQLSDWAPIEEQQMERICQLIFAKIRK